jgi:sarcosine oxidase gamma subunit
MSTPSNQPRRSTLVAPQRPTDQDAMVDRLQPPSSDESIVVDVRGPGEWIVGAPSGERSLHVYRLAPGDWLVSEVGHESEGRGTDLRQAITVLSAGGSSPDWWGAVPEALARTV